MNEIIIGAVADIAATSRDNTGCHCATKAKRIADGKNPVTNPQSVGITKLNSGEVNSVWINFQNRDVGFLVLTQYFGLERLIIGQNDGDLLGILDHMIVGDDNALFINDEAGAKRRGAALAVIITKILEKFLKGRARWELRHVAGWSLADNRRCRDVDHRRGQFFRLIGKAVRTFTGNHGNRDEHHNEASYRRNHGGACMLEGP